MMQNGTHGLSKNRLCNIGRRLYKLKLLIFQFKLCFIFSIFLFNLILFEVAFAYDPSNVIADDALAEIDAADITRVTWGKSFLELGIVQPSYDDESLSYNQFERFDVGGEEVVINNCISVNKDLGRFIEGNKRLIGPAKVIVLEVTGGKRSELRGTIRVVGKDIETKKVKLIINNSNGIVCDGCNFIGVDEVELRSDTVGRGPKGGIFFEENSYGAIAVEEAGIKTQDGGLSLVSSIIKVEGPVFVRKNLVLKSSFGKDGRLNSGKDRNIAISIYSNYPITAANIHMFTRYRGAGINIVTPKFVVDDASGKLRHLIVGNENIHIESFGYVYVKGSLYAQKSFKILGHGIAVFDPDLIDFEAKHVNESEFADGMAQIVSGGSLELEGYGVHFAKSVKLKSGGDFLKITGQVSGFGSLESKGMVSVFSSTGILLDSVDSQGDINLVANRRVDASRIDAGNIGSVNLHGWEIGVESVSNAKNLVLHAQQEVSRDPALSNVGGFEVLEWKEVNMPIDFVVSDPLVFEGDFNFIGRDFVNKNTIKARNIYLKLSGDFINEAQGKIVVDGVLESVSEGFTNYHDISVGEELRASGKTFINDNGGRIVAGVVDIRMQGWLAGEKYKGAGFYQSGNSLLESRSGQIEIAVPGGNVYFDYEKEFTGAGVNRDGYKFIGSQLLSHNGRVHIRSGKEVVFAGTKVVGDIVVEAEGKIEKNNIRVNNAYQTGAGEREKPGCGCCPKETYAIFENVVCDVAFNGRERFLSKVVGLTFKESGTSSLKTKSSGRFEKLKVGHSDLKSDIEKSSTDEIGMEEEVFEDIIG